MIGNHTMSQASMDETSPCREWPRLIIGGEDRFRGVNLAGAGNYSEELTNDELEGLFDGLIYVGQKVYLTGDQFVGLITQVFFVSGRRVSHLAIRTARILGRHKIVPIQFVCSVTFSGVQLAINHEQIRKLSKYQDDSTIAENVDRALWNDMVLRGTDYCQINICVRDGVVSLYGHVITSMNQWRVETAVKSIPGILGIKSYIIPDDKLILLVTEALEQIEQEGHSKLFTRVENGLVVLVGEVSSPDLRDEVEQLVAEIPWVRGVINEIGVTGSAVKPGGQRFLQPLVGNNLIFKDALSATIRKVVINPRNRLVVAIVVLGLFPNPLRHVPGPAYPEKNNAERMVVLPVRLISNRTPTGGLVQINSDETTQFDDYIPSRYITPDQAWLPPHPYRTDEVLFLME